MRLPLAPVRDATQIEPHVAALKRKPPIARRRADPQSHLLFLAQDSWRRRQTRGSASLTNGIGDLVPHAALPAGSRPRPAAALSVLSVNYRNPRVATELASHLLKIKHARFGSIDRENNHLMQAVRTLDGQVRLLPDTDAD